jgi:hypothetical protein
MAAEHAPVTDVDKPYVLEVIEDGLNPSQTELGTFFYPHHRFLAAVRGGLCSQEYARDVMRHAGIRFDADGRRLPPGSREASS